MSKSLKELYAVPEWMRQFLPSFNNTGGNDVEELLHDDGTSMFANAVRYTFIVSARSQFALLMDMYSKGIITGRTGAAKCSDTLTDGQLLFRLQDFYGAGQDAMEINDHEYAQECTDVVSIIREVIESRKALAAVEKYTADSKAAQQTAIEYTAGIENQLEDALARIAELERKPNWINQCDKTVPAALRYLAENPRPIGGNSPYNTEHLYDLAREIEIAASHSPVTQPVAKKLKVHVPESFHPDGDIDAPLVLDELEVIEAIVEAGGMPVTTCPRCKCELDLSHRPDGVHYCHASGKGD